MTLQQWLDQSQQQSREVQDRVRLAVDFLQRHYGVARAERVLSEIQCIDFSQPVELPAIPAQTILVGSKDRRDAPSRTVYFTKSAIDDLGAASNGRLRTNPKVLDEVPHRYEVLVPIPSGEALQSMCAPDADTWSVEGRKLLAAGGGHQFLIPNMNRYLRFMA
jgi:hypothetical protein